MSMFKSQVPWKPLLELMIRHHVDCSSEQKVCAVVKPCWWLLLSSSAFVSTVSFFSSDHALSSSARARSYDWVVSNAHLRSAVSSCSVTFAAGFPLSLLASAFTSNNWNNGGNLIPAATLRRHIHTHVLDLSCAKQQRTSLFVLSVPWEKKHFSLLFVKAETVFQILVSHIRWLVLSPWSMHFEVIGQTHKALMACVLRWLGAEGTVGCSTKLLLWQMEHVTHHDL